MKRPDKGPWAHIMPDAGCPPPLLKAFVAMLIAASMLSGCALADLALWLGKWDDTGRSVDFRLKRFELTDHFTGGQFRVGGTYDIDPNKYPKRVDFTPEEVTVTLGKDNADEFVLEPGVQQSVVRNAITKVALFAQSPEDDLSVRLLNAFLQALPYRQTVQGIYRINMYTGTYLELELNLPGDSRPKDFGQGYVNRDY